MSLTKAISILHHCMCVKLSSSQANSIISPGLPIPNAVSSQRGMAQPWIHPAAIDAQRATRTSTNAGRVEAYEAHRGGNTSSSLRLAKNGSRGNHNISRSAYPAKPAGGTGGGKGKGRVNDIELSIVMFPETCDV